MTRPLIILWVGRWLARMVAAQRRARAARARRAIRNGLAEIE
jgi:hypothetical protein